MNIEVTKVIVPANEVLGTKEKTLNYLVISEGKEKVTINVGDKTVESVQKLLKMKK